MKNECFKLCHNKQKISKSKMNFSDKSDATKIKNGIRFLIIKLKRLHVKRRETKKKQNNFQKTSIWSKMKHFLLPSEHYRIEFLI